MSVGIVPRSFGTHDGSFHADEVTATALLLSYKLIDREKIIRTREMRRLECCEFVCDVGGEFDASRLRFDHHQVDYVGEMSSAGMILAYLKEQEIIPANYFEYLNRTLVHGIDQIDNGRWEPKYGDCTFSQVIASFVPASYEAPDSAMSEAFDVAVDFVISYLERISRRFAYIEKCSEEVIAVMDEMDECLVFDKAMPWLEAFFGHEGMKHKAEFIVMPAGDQWKLRGIPPSHERRMEVRRPLPQEWAGLLGDELREKTGIDGAVFCHKGRFISIWKTKEDAIKALKRVLETPSEIK